MTSPIRLVVFDLDGTLVDSMDAFSHQASLLIEEHYGLERQVAKSRYLDTSGIPFEKQLATMFPADPRNTVVARLFEEWKIENHDAQEFRPGALKTIRELKSLGILVAISSNNTQANVDRLIRRSPIELDAALGYRGGAFEKGTGHFCWLEENLGCSRSNTLFVGDSPNDCRIAKRCGVPFLGVTVTFPPTVFRQVESAIQFVKTVENVPQWILSAGRLRQGSPGAAEPFDSG